MILNIKLHSTVHDYTWTIYEAIRILLKNQTLQQTDMKMYCKPTFIRLWENFAKFTRGSWLQKFITANQLSKRLL